MKKTVPSFSKQGCKTVPQQLLFYEWGSVGQVLRRQDVVSELCPETLWKWEKDRLTWEVRRRLPTLRRHSGAWTDLSTESVLVLWSRLLSSGLLLQNHRRITRVFSLQSGINHCWAVMQQWIAYWGFAFSRKLFFNLIRVLGFAKTEILY